MKPRRKITPDDIGAGIVGGLNFLLDLFVIVLFIVLSIYSIYSVWDIRHLYAGGDAKMFEMYKPEKNDDLSFQELTEINPDVQCWLTLYGTEIDYPVVYSEEDGKYLNTNVKGEFALSGSLFFDTDTEPDFSGRKTIIHGHHMEKNKMFGSLDDFKDKDFFDKHRYGNVYREGKSYGLQIFSVFESDAYDREVYGRTDADLEGLIKERAIQYREIGLSKDDHIVLLSTCQGGLSNNRLLVAGQLTENAFKNPFMKKEGEEGQKGKFTDRLPGYWKSVLSVGVAVIFVFMIYLGIRNTGQKRKRKETEKGGDSRRNARKIR